MYNSIFIINRSEVCSHGREDCNIYSVEAVQNRDSWQTGGFKVDERDYPAARDRSTGQALPETPRPRLTPQSLSCTEHSSVEDCEPTWEVWLALLYNNTACLSITSTKKDCGQTKFMPKDQTCYFLLTPLHYNGVQYLIRFLVWLS